MNTEQDNETVTDSQMTMASAYLSSGIVVADCIARARAMTVTLESHVCSDPCSGWCLETSDTTWVMRFVKNDAKRTRALQIENLEKGLRCVCKRCSEKHFQIADVLDQHLTMLRCVERRDDKGATRAASRRGDLLRKLGYKVA